MHKRDKVCDNRTFYHIENVDIVVWQEKGGKIEIQIHDKTGENKFTCQHTGNSVPYSPNFTLKHREDKFLDGVTYAGNWFKTLLKANNL